MHRALFLVLALSLAACGLSGGKPDAAKPAGLSTDTIEVTPLDAPPPGAAVLTDAGAASAAAALAATAGTPAATAGTSAAATPASQPDTAAPDTAAPDTIPVTAATATTPHPKPRPAGLGQGAEAPPPVPPKTQPQLLCEASGGVWGQSGTSGVYLCQKKTHDGGKICHAKSDCSGQCLAPSGTCAPVVPLMGCNDVLDSEGRTVTLCLN